MKSEYAKNTEEDALVQRKIFNFRIFALILFIVFVFSSFFGRGFLPAQARAQYLQVT